MENTRRYFEEKSEFWVNSAYKQGEYNYPVGFHRLRILKKILGDYNPKGKTLLDIGCGGGDISIEMAERGFNVIGIDVSESMLEISNKRKESLPAEIAERIKFIKSDFNDIKEIVQENSADVIVAFGFIGYLDNDDDFFKTANQLLKENGKLIVSFRNRLFNMTSISDYTTNEINNSHAIGLIDQLDELFKCDIPLENIKEFASSLNMIVNNIDSSKLENIKDNEDKDKDKDVCNDELRVEARQHIPNEVLSTSRKYNFENTRVYGVHPHLLIPRLNNMLTPQLFNQLSDSLIPFEELPISLSWSSVFIGEYNKKSNIKEGE